MSADESTNLPLWVKVAGVAALYALAILPWMWELWWEVPTSADGAMPLWFIGWLVLSALLLIPTLLFIAYHGARYLGILAISLFGSHSRWQALDDAKRQELGMGRDEWRLARYPERPALMKPSFGKRILLWAIWPFDEGNASRWSRWVDVPASTEDVTTLIEKLADLRDKGLITASEYNGKKKDLLARM